MNLVEIPGITHVAGGDVLFTSLWYTVLLYTATGDIMKMKWDCKMKENTHTPKWEQKQKNLHRTDNAKKKSLLQSKIEKDKVI